MNPWSIPLALVVVTLIALGAYAGVMDRVNTHRARRCDRWVADWSLPPRLRLIHGTSEARAAFDGFGSQEVRGLE